MFRARIEFENKFHNMHLDDLSKTVPHYQSIFAIEPKPKTGINFTKLSLLHISNNTAHSRVNFNFSTQN